MSHLLRLLTGPEDIGRSRWFWAAFVVVCVFLFVYPHWLSEFEATNNAYYLLNVPIALGLALLWGYCGILSFGEVAYFGVAGYVYGIVAGNMIWFSTMSVSVIDAPMRIPDLPSPVI